MPLIRSLEAHQSCVTVGIKDRFYERLKRAAVALCLGGPIETRLRPCLRRAPEHVATTSVAMLAIRPSEPGIARPSHSLAEGR